MLSWLGSGGATLSPILLLVAGRAVGGESSRFSSNLRVLLSPLVTTVLASALSPYSAEGAVDSLFSCAFVSDEPVWELTDCASVLTYSLVSVSVPVNDCELTAFPVRGPSFSSSAASSDPVWIFPWGELSSTRRRSVVHFLAFNVSSAVFCWSSPNHSCWELSSGFPVGLEEEFS